MKSLKNKRGMTLVEVIVVLLIASILLVIMGSLILNSFGYFNKTTNQDLSKRSLDSLSSFVREQLLYASDVRVLDEYPKDIEGEWKSLYVSEGKLYYDDNNVYSSDDQIFSDAFYNRNKLSIEVKGYGNYRLDLSYTYTNSDKEKEYGTNDTLELLNLEVQSENNEAFNPLGNIQNKVVLDNSGTKRIYFLSAIQNGEAPNPDDPTTGTVSKQLDCLSLHNNRQKYIANAYYRKGDMVYHNGFWWTMVSNSGNYVPESLGPGKTNTYWKKIDSYFDENSAYEYGDIIIFKDIYYICSKNIINIGKTPKPGTSEDWGGFWDVFDGPRETFSCQWQRTEKNIDSVIYQLQNLIDKEVFKFEDIPLYDSDKKYSYVDTPTKATDFVKIVDESLGGTYRYFIKKYNDHSSVAPGDKVEAGKKLVWQEIKVDWDPNSYYEEKDVVFYSTANNTGGYMSVRDGKIVDVGGIVPSEWNDSQNPWTKKNVTWE